MNGLDELFEQILHSERNFKARINKLRELSSKIQQCQVELQQMRERTHALQGELVVKNMKLADMEVKCKLLCVCKNILQEQRDTLYESKRQLAKELNADNKELESQRQSFADKLTEFGCCFDLHGSGYKYREEEARKKVSVLQEELVLLETELMEMDSQKDEVSKLEKELADIEHKLKLERDRDEELKRLESEQDAEARRLEEEKKACNQKFSKDPEFIRLQRELEACKNCPEELVCQSLSKELEELQKRCYHKQMRQHFPQQRGSIGTNSSAIPSGNSTSFRISGHYNPYTHQYVPARNVFQGVAPSRPDSSTSGSTTADNLRGGETLVNDSGFQDEQNLSWGYEGDNSEMSLVDEEWLMDDDDNDDISVELDKSELALLEDDLHTTFNDINDPPMDKDFTEDNRNLRVLHSVQRNGRLAESGSSLDGGSNKSSTRKYSSAFGNVRSKPTAAAADSSAQVSSRRRLLHPSSFHQPTAQRGSEKPSETDGGSNSSTRAYSCSTSSTLKHSTSASSGDKPGNLVRTKTATVQSSLNPKSVRVPARGGGERGRTSGIVVCSSRITDSSEPDSLYAQRKRPGQSIFKAPGHQQRNPGLPRSAKKVRFHY